MRTINGYNLTLEQNILIEYALYGLDVIGAAGAGTGKTTTLCAIDKYKSREGKKGHYICFNKALAEDAKGKFSSSINISTAHSLAYSAICRPKTKWKEKLSTRLHQNLTIKFAEIDISTSPLKNNFLLCRAIHDAVENFCNSASLELSEIHISNSILSPYLTEKKKNPNICIQSYYIEYVVKHANKLLVNYLDSDSNCPSSHSGYIKKWQLSNPVINTDYILYDEAQDANPVMLAIILSQKCQKILCGDRYQSIYSFMNAINAISFIPFLSCPISTSFRYSQELADLANKLISSTPTNDKINLIGKGNKTTIYRASEYKQFDRTMIISRTNATLFEYLVLFTESNIKTHLGINMLNHYIVLIEQLLDFSVNEDPNVLPKNLKHIKRWADLIKNRDADIEIVRIAMMIEENPIRAKKLIPAINKCLETKESEAQVLLTTAHKSKGLEADTVLICDDYQAVIKAYIDNEPLAQEELHLLYVAITRAKKTLVISDELYDLLISNKELLIEPTTFEPFAIDRLIEISQQALINNPIPSQDTLDSIKHKATLPYSTEERVSIESIPKPAYAESNATEWLSSGLNGEDISFDQLLKSNWHLPLNIPFSEQQKIIKMVANSTNQKVESKHFQNAVCNAFPVDGYLSVKIGDVGHEVDINKPEQQRLFDTTKIPQFWTPLDSSKFENPNLAIVGTMGTGKTQLVKSILYNLHKQRHLNCGQSLDILIFDYKEDYCDDTFVKKTGATVLTPHKLPMNPFSIFSKDAMATLKTADMFVNSLVRSYKIGVNQQRTIRNIILHCYEAFGLQKNNIASLNNTPPTIYDVCQLYMMQEKVPNDMVTAVLDNLVNYEVFTDDPTAPPYLIC